MTKDSTVGEDHKRNGLTGIVVPNDSATRRHGRIKRESSSREICTCADCVCIIEFYVQNSWKFIILSRFLRHLTGDSMTITL